MLSSVMCLHTLFLILIACLQPCFAAPHETSEPHTHTLDLTLPSLSSFTGAIERMANYGYQMLGYGPQETYEHYDVKDKKTIWDGHIGVPDFVSPLLEYMPDTSSYGDERVVKGHDGRLGFRVAVPYFGDLQYIREYGPGRFTDKLGPGKYVYPGLDGRPKNEDDSYPPPKPSYHHEKTNEVYPEQMYQGLQNYPWNV